MPLDIQTAGPTEAVRRSFGMRGGVRMALDETIVPVVDAAPSLDQPPWRSDGKRWWNFNNGAAVVGDFPWHGVINRSRETFITVDEIIFTNNSASAQTLQVGIGSNDPTGVATIAPSSITTETDPNMPAIFDQTPVAHFGGGGTAVEIGNGGAPQTFIAIFLLPAASHFIWQPKEPINLPPGPLDNTQGLVIVGANSNLALQTTFAGRVWYAR